MTVTTETLAHADIGTDGRIWIRSDYRVKDSIKAVPGARWDGDNKVWTVPLAWTSCLALRAQLGAALALGDDLRAWAFGVKADKGTLATFHRTIELDGWLPDPDPHADLAGFAALYPYQRVGAEAIALAKG